MWKLMLLIKKTNITRLLNYNKIIPNMMAPFINSDYKLAATKNVLYFQVFLKTLRKIVCLSDDSYYLLDDKESVSLQSIEKHPVNADQAIRNDGNKLERDVAEILRHVNTIVIRTAMAESRSNTRSEWYQVGIVFDRIMCFLFVLIFIVYSCALLS
jgi:hypothetical protein